MKTVLCYGDSNTYGYDPRNGQRYPKDVRWTTILQDLLGSDYEVVVEGLNGRTTAFDSPEGTYRNGLPYLEACLASHKPIDYVVFMLGTNDCNANLNISSDDIAKGMEKLIITTKNFLLNIQANEAKIIVIVPASIGTNYKSSPFAYQLNEDSIKKSKEIATLYKNLSIKHCVNYLDCSFLEVSDIDSEHLTIESHKQLATMLFNKINNI